METSPKTNRMNEDPMKYKNVKVGDLLESISFRGGVAIVLDKRVEWELTPISNEHFEWGLVQVADAYGDVFWFELAEHDCYLVKNNNDKTLDSAMGLLLF